MDASLTIAFHGAAQTVTGSRHLIRFGPRSWLFDCGIYQGHREEADRINRTFAFSPSEIEGVVLSHAHLDHAGNLPTLVAGGCRGPIHATPATAELSQVMLADSAHLMQRDHEFVQRRGGRPVPSRPLFTATDVETTVRRFVTHPYHEGWPLAEGIEVRYYDAGHILGAALTTLEFRNGAGKFRLGMSGDLGRGGRPILNDPEVHPGVDALVMESTYGDRLHAGSEEARQKLAEVVTRTVERGGRVLVPAFAVGRAQELVATLHQLTQEGRLPSLPIFVDSPMARDASEIYVRHPEILDPPTQRAMKESHGAPFGFERLRYVQTPEESKSLNGLAEPCIIVSASGMCEGGRILHHLRHGIGNPRNTVLFVGFQAENTLGRRIVEGAESVRIYGESFRVAADIVSLGGFSAHADQRELIDWVGKLEPRPRRIFLVHGEPGPAGVLAERLRDRWKAEVHVPRRGEEFRLWN